MTSAHPEAPPPAVAKARSDRPVPAAKGPIAAEDVERAAQVLISYLGPIASLVSKRESQASASLEDLHQRLAALIPSERDRTDFLKRVEAR